MFSRNLSRFFCGTLLVLTLAGCGKTVSDIDATEIITLPTAPTQESTVNPYADVTELSAVMAAGELYTLDQYPNLQSVDLSGSDCYDAIVHYQSSHPKVSVRYSVDFGGTVVAHDAQSVTLSGGHFSYENILENLQYLPQLKTLHFPDISLDAQQVTALGERYPLLELSYTVELLGQSYDASVTQLDLSSMDASMVAQACPRLGLLTQLETVQLGSQLSMADVDKLQAANPNATFLYQFQLFGKTISTGDTQVEFKNLNIGNSGEEQIRQALNILDNCQRFVLDNCKLDYEVLAKIREDYKDKTTVAWRVYFGVDGRYNVLTDQEVLRAVYNVTDETSQVLKYCTGIKYLDMGHNEYLTDLSFLGYMPELAVAIISGSAVKKLEGLENCKKLTWLELASCYKLEDIECLSGCENLQYLNISFSKVSSFAALDSLPLKRFVYLKPKASTAEQNTFVSIHDKASCITVFYGYSNPLGYGWRYDDNGKTFNKYYKEVVRTAFNYDYLEQFLPKDNK